MAAFSQLTILIGLFLMGLGSGFVSSTPLGPINLYVANALASRVRRTVLWFVAGVIAADVAYAGLAFFGFHSAIYHGSLMTKIVGIAGGLFLVALGVLALRALHRRAESPADETPTAPTPRGRARAFALGAFLCGSNPCFLLFWISVLRFAQGVVAFDTTIPGLACFLTGVAAGDSLWFLLITRFVSRQVGSVQPRFIVGFRHATAWAFVGLGAFAMVKSLVLIPLDDARSVAQQLYPGDVDSAELSLEDGRLVFAVDMVRAGGGDGLVHDVQVDALTGKFVRLELQAPDDDEDGGVPHPHAILTFSSRHPRRPGR